jgi:hypothetical protein
MDIGSLRLNNFLRNKSTKEVFKVKKLETLYDADRKAVVSFINDLNAENIEGIALNDTLLLENCCFEVKRNISCFVIAVLLQDVDRFYMDDKFVLIKENGIYKYFLDNFSTESTSGVEEKKIKYLHQLQNIYRLFADEELYVQM